MSQTTEKKLYENVKIPCRISYPFLAEKSKEENGVPGKFRVQCLIEKSDQETILNIRRAMKAVWVENCGEDPAKWARTNFRKPDFFKTHLSEKGQDGFPLRDGDLQFGKEEYQNLVYIQAADGKNQPSCGKVVQGGWTPLTTKEEIQQELYAGCYANVHVDFFYIKPSPSNGNNTGIGCSLKAVIKTADGERLSGSAPIDLSNEYGEEIITPVSSNSNFSDL